MNSEYEQICAKIDDLWAEVNRINAEMKVATDRHNSGLEQLNLTVSNEKLARRGNAYDEMERLIQQSGEIGSFYDPRRSR